MTNAETHPQNENDTVDNIAEQAASDDTSRRLLESWTTHAAKYGTAQGFALDWPSVGKRAFSLPSCSSQPPWSYTLISAVVTLGDELQWLRDGAAAMLDVLSRLRANVEADDREMAAITDDDAICSELTACIGHACKVLEFDPGWAARLNLGLLTLAIVKEREPGEWLEDLRKGDRKESIMTAVALVESYRMLAIRIGAAFELVKQRSLPTNHVYRSRRGLGRLNGVGVFPSGTDFPPTPWATKRTLELRDALKLRERSPSGFFGQAREVFKLILQARRKRCAIENYLEVRIRDVLALDTGLSEIVGDVFGLAIMHTLPDTSDAALDERIQDLKKLDELDQAEVYTAWLRQAQRLVDGLAKVAKHREADPVIADILGDWDFLSVAQEEPNGNKGTVTMVQRLATPG